MKSHSGMLVSLAVSMSPHMVMPPGFRAARTRETSLPLCQVFWQFDGGQGDF
ncbi:hypothetical protein AB3X55_11815 [Alphaproteobacteria bacterium LSUCC0719]